MGNDLPNITYVRVGNAVPVYAVKMPDGGTALLRSGQDVAMMLPEFSKRKVRQACRAARDGLKVTLLRERSDG